MKHTLRLTLGLNYIQLSSISNLAAWQVLSTASLSAVLSSCCCLELSQPWGSALLKTDSGELSTEQVFGRIKAIVLLNGEDSPGEQTGQDVLESFRRALRCIGLHPS